MATLESLEETLNIQGKMLARIDQALCGYEPGTGLLSDVENLKRKTASPFCPEHSTCLERLATLEGGGGSTESVTTWRKSQKVLIPGGIFGAIALIIYSLVELAK